MKRGKNQCICKAGWNKMLPCPGFVLSAVKSNRIQSSPTSYPTKYGVLITLFISPWLLNQWRPTVCAKIISQHLFNEHILHDHKCFPVRVISTASVKQMEETRDDGGKGHLAKISNTFEHFLSDDKFAFELHVYLFCLLWFMMILNFHILI